MTLLHIEISTYYLFSEWLKTYSEFSKSAPMMPPSCRLYNNHAEDTRGHRQVLARWASRCSEDGHFLKKIV